MTTPAVRARTLSKRFGRTTWALREVDLVVAPGEVVGYLGPNGAGKTTTLRLLLGMLRPTAGSVQVFGIDATRDPVAAHGRLAYVPGEANLWPNLTGGQVLDFLAELHRSTDYSYRSQLVETFRLDPGRKVREYSKGNRQKLALIAALATRAPLLLLDEPTAGLDPLMEQAFRSEIAVAKDRGQAVLLSSHVLAEVEALSDPIAILRDGRIVDMGTLEQLRALSAVVVEATFAAAVPDVGQVPGVQQLTTSGETLRCRVHGPIQPLLRMLAAHDVVHLDCREPSLEELFLSHYGAGDSASAGDPAQLTRAVR